MNIFSRSFKRLFYIDIDSYFLFSDSFTPEWISENSRHRPSGLDVVFEVVDRPCDDTGLISLCEEGGYFGRDAPSISKYLRQRDQLGDSCVVARHGTQCIGMAWVLLGKRSDWPSFAKVPYEESDTGLLHQIYVRPDYRGFHLQRFLDIHQKKHLFDNKINSSLTFVGVKNFSSIRNAMTCNERFRLIYHLSIDIPLIGRKNLFPKWSEEGWNNTHFHAARWSPESESVKEGDQFEVQGYENG